MSQSLISTNNLHFDKPKSQRGKHNSPRKSLLTIGNKTLPRSQWPKYVGIGAPTWYERLRKFDDPNIDFTEKDLLAPAKTKAQAGKMGAKKSFYFQHPEQFD